MNRNDVNRKTWYLLILMPIIYLAVSVLVVFLVKNNGAYPTGSDTMYHIFRGDYVYNSIKEGSWYPIYNSMWYNGVEIMRYWAPLTAYYMALCQMIAALLLRLTFSTSTVVVSLSVNALIIKLPPYDLLLKSFQPL